MADGAGAARTPTRGRVFTRGLYVLWTAIRTEPGPFGLAMFGAVLHATVTVGSASVLGYITSEIILPSLRAGDTTAAALWTAAGLLLGVGVLKATGLAFRRLFAGLMQYRMQAHYRRRVSHTFLRLPLAWHHRHPTGQLLSNAGSDVEAAWQPLAPLPMAIGTAYMLVIAAASMLITDLVLALVGFLVFPAIALLNYVYQHRLSPLATRAQALRARVSEVAHESFDGALVVKTLGREDAETERFTAAASRLRDAQIKVGRVRGMFDPVMEALPNLGVLVVLLVGVLRIEGGAMTPGELVQFAFLFTLLAFPIRSFGWILGDLPRAVVGWDRMQAVLTARGSTAYGTARLPAGQAPGGVAVTAEGVTFGYEDGYRDASGADRDGISAGDLGGGPDPGEGGTGPRTTVLHGVDLAIPPGRTVAIVGPTGAGKSTLASLLLRLVDPDSGTLRYDGTDLRELAKGEISRTAALVPQTTFVFDDTVRENIALGAPATDGEIWTALRLAHADAFVRALPDGLDSRLGERGTSLSGGQRQRIALARALVRRPRLLVLDDATSAVDPQVEEHILTGLRRADLAATVVVIAYRRSTIALADEVVYLEGGRVVATGTHDELTERVEGYRRLVTAYQRDEEQRAAEAAAGLRTEPTDVEESEAVA
ncbi:ABC transporter ATP-binding protein [Allonocardiopsis opalescens]|nr:ABC transporter ATP-binding protein [Allonocardiopsis opalescens]